MTCIQAYKAFDAFESQLKTLCLKEFPCGTGSWRENSIKKEQVDKRGKVSTKFSVTTKDYGSNNEKTETLEELVNTKKSPWNLDYSWSDEAKQLRQIAIRSPWLIDENFVLDYFKTMRIVDKNVEEIDEQFLRFHHLEELSLSANHLKTVNSRNLPTKLKVLELCANNISSLSDFCLKPPPLQHLGLSHNKLSMVDDYISGEYWPHLLSLDLGHNSLSDLMDMIRKLQSLPKLRNLILQGNPLALVPGYRGYTIDTLRNLFYLDDISITADERHHFKGLSKRKEYILDEAKIQLHVSYIKNIPMPEEIMNPDDQPEYPMITYKYYVQFLFLEDKSANAEIFQILHDDDLSQLTLSHAAATENQELITACETQSAAATEILQSDAEANKDQQEKSSSFPSEAEVKGLHEDDIDKASNTDDVTVVEPEEHLKETSIQITHINSESSSWQEEIILNWNKVAVRDDLLALRDFFQKGMTINVIQERVQSYPADQVQDGQLSPTTSSQKAKDKKGKKDEKTKEKSVKEEKKKDKKKKESDIDMVELPPEISTLAQFQMDLVDLLNGEFSLEETFIKEIISDDQKSKVDESETGTHKNNKENKKDKKKPASAKKKDDKDKNKDKGRDKSPNRKKDDKNEKGKKGGAVVIEEEDVSPQAMEIHVKIQLHHWKTAIDLMKTVQEGQLPQSDI